MTMTTLEGLESEYYFDRGRRFNKSIRYILPSDLEENDRLSKQHFCIKVMRDNKNSLAPVQKQLEQGIRVLDSACGFGAPWTMDMVKEYPNSRYFGVDISDGIPSKDKNPENTNFFIGNITKSFPFDDNTFDYGFQRLTVLALSNDEWNSNLKELYRVLKPGAFLEMLEIDYSRAYNAGPLFTMFMEKLYQVSQNVGIVLPVALELKDRLKEIGFIESVMVPHEYPLNHGKNGKLNWITLREAFKTMETPLSQVFEQWKDSVVYDQFLNDLTEELIVYKSYIQFHTTYAKKP